MTTRSAPATLGSKLGCTALVVVVSVVLWSMIERNYIMMAPTKNNLLLQRLNPDFFVADAGSPSVQRADGGNSKLAHHRDISSYWWPCGTSGGIVGAIHKRQHPASCQNATLFVFRSSSNPERDTRGLSAWAASASAHMAHAFAEGRILIQDEVPWPMSKGCEIQTRECYFEPLSSCSIRDADPILINNNNNEKEQQNVVVLENPDDPYDSRKVRTVYSTRAWFRPMDDRLRWAGMGPNQNRLLYDAASLAYYFRPQPWLRDEIHRRLRRSIPENLNPDQTIGVPIRRSDKCQGHALEGSAGGEMECPSLEEYLEACRQFVEFDTNIRYVMVTSEDEAAVNDFTKMIRASSTLTNHHDLTVVTNVGDVRQGTGSATQLETYRANVTNREVVASALTSLHMHLRARYLVLTTLSTWTSTIAILTRVYGFSTGDVLVKDLRQGGSGFQALARLGYG